MSKSLDSLQSHVSVTVGVQKGNVPEHGTKNGGCEMKKEDKKKLCAGCYNSIYNGGMAPECWNLKDAKVMKRKRIGINDIPPWDHQPVSTTLSCFRQPGYVFVDPKTMHLP